MTEEELKNKCTERAKIFQQAMESCKSSSPMDCIEWFADRIAELEKENAELKARVGLSIECDKAQKNGELCLGYGGDEDEPCERCKNCIKCACGYYQLGETEKDKQLNQWKDEWQEQVQKATDEGYARTLQTIQITKAKEIMRELLSSCFGYNSKIVNYEVKAKAEQFLKGDGCLDVMCEDCTKEDCGTRQLGLVEVEK